MRAGKWIVFALVCGCALLGCEQQTALSGCRVDSDCPGYGRCDLDMGKCLCQAGYQGLGCADCAPRFVLDPSGICKPAQEIPPALENPTEKNSEISCNVCNEAQVETSCAALCWVKIPGGSYMMGCIASAAVPCAKNEAPAHEVNLKDFQLSKTEVTVAQYGKCVEHKVCGEPGSGGSCNWSIGWKANHPINCVAWEQAVLFCRWVGGRLASEAEWEYAARGRGANQPFPWGSQAATCEYAVMNDPNAGGYGCGAKGSMPVCSKPKGNTGQGLCDMAGNVSEWIKDWMHDSYTGAPPDGSAWEAPAGTLRILRGGGWVSTEAGGIRASDRSFDLPQSTYGGLGFRCARTIGP